MSGDETDTWEHHMDCLIALDRLRRLATNLERAGMLCAAQQLEQRYGYIVNGEHWTWRPGCGRPAPSLGRPLASEGGGK